MVTLSMSFLVESHHALDVEHSFMSAQLGESSHTHHDHSIIQFEIDVAPENAPLRLPVHELYGLDPSQNYYATIERPPESLSLS